MRNFWGTVGVLVLAQCLSSAQTQIVVPPGQLVREVVYNELHDHAGHGFWRYWIEHNSARETQLVEQLETLDGPITRLSLSNGHPLDKQARQQETDRLGHLLASPTEQARHRQEYAEDEKRIGRILALLPDAFLYEDLGEENGCRKLRFRPNPDYPAHSIEARIFHAMSGELWVSSRYKHMVRLDGQLQENVDFGYGILGRLYKGGWFRLQRTQVSSTDWKTERLEIHMNGRAMLFKTIARETSEVRRGFVPVPAGMNLAQGLLFLQQSEAATAQVSPTALVAHR